MVPLLPPQLPQEVSEKGQDLEVEPACPGLGESPGGGRGNTLQYSCLENPMGRGAWCATVHRVTKNWTGLKQLSMHR